MAAYTVDVSHHDWDRAGGRLDWERAAQSGITAACVRATYGDPQGTNWPTPHARDMLRAARTAGLTTGAYHNLIRGDAASIRRQVDWLRSEMDATGAQWGMVDVERYEELLARDLHPRLSDTQAWCDRWRAVDPRPMLVYLPRWVWQHMGSPALTGLRCPLVASDYGPNSPGAPAALYSSRGGDSGRGWQPYGGVTPTIWQYGSQGLVPGLSSKSDVNAYRGSAAQLRALLTGKEDIVTVTDEDAQKIARAVHAQLLGASKTTIGVALQQTHSIALGLDRQLQTLLAAILGVDEEVVAKLGGSGGMSPAQIADVLRPVLGDQAAAVGAALAGV